MDQREAAQLWELLWTSQRTMAARSSELHQNFPAMTSAPIMQHSMTSLSGTILRSGIYKAYDSTTDQRPVCWGPYPDLSRHEHKAACRISKPSEAWPYHVVSVSQCQVRWINPQGGSLSCSHNSDYDLFKFSSRVNCHSFSNKKQRRLASQLLLLSAKVKIWSCWP
jgi:hypothetical protein